MPFVGTFCFDVKAKTRYSTGNMFDRSELEKLARFGEIFAVSVFLACLEDERQAWWLRVADLAALPPNHKGIITVPLDYALAVDMTAPLQEALHEVARV